MVVLRVFKVVWFISLMAALGELLFSYASLQGDVQVYSNGTASRLISPDSFFYIGVAFLALINVLVFIVAKIVAKRTEFRTWFYGLIITFNIFCIVSMGFIALYNSAEAYNFQRLQPIIYGSVILFLAWTIGWPVYLGYKKILGQS
jgi:hypothetical protein